MFEVIDTLLGPLFRLNPLKYAFDRAYRRKKQDALGREARYVFRYQVAFALVVLVALAMFGIPSV